MRSFLAGLILALAVPACTDNEAVIPTGIAGNDFFVQWQITATSLGRARISCADANATAVTMSVLEQTTGVVASNTFTCEAYQGRFVQQFGTDSVYDVTLSLVNEINQALSIVSIRGLEISVPGTVDLGVVSFTIP